MRRGTYLALIVLMGLLGGLAMGAIAGARRTQSSFPVYLASTNPSDVGLFTEFAPITGTGHSASLERAISRIPHIKRWADVIGFDGTLQEISPVRGHGVPGEAPPAFEGSLNGSYSSVDRVTLISGRLADPGRADEFVISAGGAKELGLRIGSTLRLAFFTDAQTSSPTFAGYPADKPHLVVTMKLVGIIETGTQIVQDDDSALGDQLAVATPALTRELATCCAYYSGVSLQIDGGASNERAVLSAVDKVLPNLGPVSGTQTNAPFVAKAERALRPESIAFGVFGALAGLAALLICAQVVGRGVRSNRADSAVLRALGAGPAMTTLEAVVGLLGSIVLGALLAVVVAVALSPLAPIGPVRSVFPDRGVSFDWTVLGSGFALLIVVLSAVAFVLAFRGWRQRSTSERAVRAGSGITRITSTSGLSVAAVLGIRSALGGGGRGDAAPVRSAILGAILAVAVVVTSLTFGASLTALSSHPAQYGWNWDYALLAGFSAAEDLPATSTATLLNNDTAVGQWTGVSFESANLDGRPVPVLATSPNAAVGPSLLAGHDIRSAQEVVLGPATLASLHKRIGQTVVADTGSSHRRLRIVGTATLPTIGGSGMPQLQMGTGAVLATSLFSASALNQQGSTITGPNAVFITIRPGVSPSAALRSLDRVDRSLSNGPDAPPSGVVSVLRPAEISANRAAGSTPSDLAWILAAGALGALGLTLVASVRRRRRELALLKAMGVTERQLASTVGWQSSVSVAVGLIVGTPLGIAFGRWLWTEFARGFSAVPDPTTPLVPILLVALGGLAFANIVAAVPGRIAARTPTALLLRAE